MSDRNIVLTDGLNAHFVCRQIDGALPVIVAMFEDVYRASAYAALLNSQVPEPVEDQPKPPARVVKPASAKAAPSASTAEETRAAESRAAVRKMWDEGRSPAEIAKQLGVTESRVYQIKKQLGLPNRPPANPAPTKARQPPPAPVLAATPAVEDYNRLGVTLRLSPGNESISKGGDPIPLTLSQTRLAHVLLRAAPSPVGHDFIYGKLYVGRSKEEAQRSIQNTATALSSILSPIGLGVREVKGIGFQMTGVDA